jgi:hypothetical protein
VSIQPPVHGYRGSFAGIQQGGHEFGH